MKIVDRYYERLHKQTAKMTKKLFGEDIAGCLALRYEVRKHLENTVGKTVEEITYEDICKNKLCYEYAKYKTLSKILEVVETACTLKTFTIEEYENEC